MLARWFRNPGVEWRVVAIVEAADEVPDLIKKRGVVLVGTTRQPKWLVFDCPCETGHRIMLPMDSRQRRFWRIVNQRHLTVWPSVDSQRPERRCHFSLQYGQIRWVKSEDELDEQQRADENTVL